MEIRRTNIIINNAGGNSGGNSLNYKISLPSKWMNELGITKENTHVEISFDGERIVIEQVLSVKKFIKRGLESRHIMKQLNFYNENELCTTIFADFTDKALKIKNENCPAVLLAFGNNNMPTWKDFVYFLEERCVPRSRDNIRHYLNELELSEYNPLDIILKTEGRMAEDKQWLEVVDLK